MSEHVDVSNIKDPSIAAARKEVEFQRAMNPCPIDFSEFQSSNPRSQGEQKEYEGKDASNFNRRQKYSDSEEPQFTEKDPVLGIHSLGEAYRKGDPNYDARSTVPAIVDVTTGAVVNNDYHALTTELALGFKDFISPDAPDIYPEELRADIDALNVIIYADFNLAVNLAALVTNQKDYEYYYDRIFARLDWLEERLSKQRYLMGDTITDPDIRIFPTLARFDLVFYQKYLVNKKRLVDYPNLWNYAKDLYSNPAFGGTTDFDSMRKRFYYVDHTPFEDLPRLIPKGPDDSIWLEPNNRAEKFGK